MAVLETIRCMLDQQERLHLVASIFLRQVEYVPKPKAQLRREWPLSLGTWTRITKGDPSVNPRFYRLIEKELNLPDRLLDAVIDGDVAAIEDMDFADAGLRRFVLDSLTGANSSRRRNRGA